jgi:hypothetical protein
MLLDAMVRRNEPRADLAPVPLRQNRRNVYCESVDCPPVEHIVKLSVVAPPETGCQAIDFPLGDSSLGRVLP